MMLTGDNGILKRAGEAKDLSEVEKEKEYISLAYNSIIMDKMHKESDPITVDEFDKAIKTYDTGASVTSEREKLVVTFSNEHKYSIYNNGKVTEYTTKPYAVDELVVKVSGDSVESLYYVNYPSAAGTIKCRVLYNDATYGLQIISVNPVTKVRLGYKDPNENLTGEIGSVERAQSSYNRSIVTLNEKAEEYTETNDGSILATDARCVGSNPLNKNYPDNLTGEERMTKMFVADSSYSNMKDYNGKFFDSDNNYFLDSYRLRAINAIKVDVSNTVSPYYWMASRFVSMYNWIVSFSGAFIVDNSKITGTGWWSINETGVCNASSGPNLGLRPVFILSPNVKIIGGEGTEEVPFEIGL